MPVFLAKIRITLRPSILDPQGKAVEHAISILNAGAVRDVRMGKYIEMHVDSPDETQARKTTDEVCKKLLANPVMEDFTYELVRI